MKCRDCIYWKESIYAFRRESSGDCHVEPITIPKDGDDFCGKYVSKYKKEV